MSSQHILVRSMLVILGLNQFCVTKSTHLTQCSLIYRVSDPPTDVIRDNEYTYVSSITYMAMVHGPPTFVNCKYKA